jgi:hypothetical protein
MECRLNLAHVHMSEDGDIQGEEIENIIAGLIISRRSIGFFKPIRSKGEKLYGCFYRDQ